MMKLSEICESHWSEMNRRSQGITRRKEEDLESFNRSGFFEYLKSRYKVINAPAGEDIWSSERSDITEIPILEDPKRKYTLSGKNYNFVYKLQIWNIDTQTDMSFHISASSIDRKSIFSETLEKQFRIVTDSYLWYEIRPNAIQGGSFPELTKMFIIKVIDFIIENPGPYKPILTKR